MWWKSIRAQMERIIFHVDVNSAFLSWEATRRVAEGMEDLRLIPSIIGGDPERRTSIVLAKSIPAKRYGIVTGEPVSAAFRKCPQLVSVGSDFVLYSEMSGAFKDICRQFSPIVEEFSIDECFIDMTGMGRIYPNPIEAAYLLKDRIKKELGFTVNVGVAHNKLLAKMASDFEKPDKVHTLFDSEIADKMWPLPVSELFLCGRSSAAKLKRMHIETIGELAACDAKTIQAVLGNKAGLQMWQFANGISDSDVNGEAHVPKGYSNEITFDDNITDFKGAERVLLHLADSVASRVRKDDVRGRCVSVTIRGNDMKKRSHQKKLDKATDSTSGIYDVSKKLFDELWDGVTPLRLIGLSLSEMGEDEEMQISMFDQSSMTDQGAINNITAAIDENPAEMKGNSEKDRKADKAVDALREKFGNDIIKRGGMINSNIKVRKR